MFSTIDALPCICLSLRVDLPGGDIAKVFMRSPQCDDDGEYFYGVLPPSSQAGTDRPRLLPTSKQSLNPAVALLQAIVIVRDARALPYQNIECFPQARFVRITHGRLAIWLDPLGMLDPQVIVNPFSQVCVRMKLVKHNH